MGICPPFKKGLPVKYKELGFIVEKQKGEAEEYSVIISTSQPDRMGDVVVSSGINYSNYMATNPIVLFNHGRDMQVGSAPIAKSTSMKTFKNKVESKFVFAEGDEQAARIKNLWETGYLNAASIGAIPTKVEDMEPKGDDLFSQLFPPQRILECELVEYSLVTIPANSGAIRKEMDAQFMKLLELIDQKLSPVGEILKKAQEIESNITILKQIEKKEVEELPGVVPYVHYGFSSKEWNGSFLKENQDIDYSFAYAYGNFAPHHMIEDGSILTSPEAMYMGYALINGSTKDIEGAKEAYNHLRKHHYELFAGHAPDYAHKQWSPLQTVSFLRSEKVSEDNILLVLVECGVELSEALKYVKVVGTPEEKSDSTSEEFDVFLQEILSSCKSIVELVG